MLKAETDWLNEDEEQARLGGALGDIEAGLQASASGEALS
jgi:hypothetical protein